MTMTTIIAYIPARKTTFAGKPHVYPARTATFEQDEQGRCKYDQEPILEADVIDICRKAKNWPEIKSVHFPMFGFHPTNGED
jgi:hypothetical protein